MKPLRLALALVAVVLVIVLWGTTGSRIQASLASTAVQYSVPQASGRPGVFRFYSNREIQQDRVELAELRAGIDRLQRLLPDVQDAAAQQELKLQLAHWQTRIIHEEQRMEVSASPVAAEVETRLNEMKGTRSCGVCHGTENIGRNIPVSTGGGSFQ